MVTVLKMLLCPISIAPVLSVHRKHNRITDCHWESDHFENPFISHPAWSWMQADTGGLRTLHRVTSSCIHMTHNSMPVLYTYYCFAIYFTLDLLYIIALLLQHCHFFTSLYTCMHVTNKTFKSWVLNLTWAPGTVHWQPTTHKKARRSLGKNNDKLASNVVVELIYLNSISVRRCWRHKRLLNNCIVHRTRILRIAM